MAADFAIGIDLGTTNSALAFSPLSEANEDKPTVSHMPIPQVVQPGQVEALPLLPSSLYLPGEGELPAGSLALPWDAKRNYSVGQFAKTMGEKVPARLVSSAKSWLCHAGVDRRAEILPWQPENTEAAKVITRKVSPVVASTRFLEHLKESFNSAHKGKKLENQEIVLTVPASFDAVARQLTVEAATAAGLDKLSLLEEPQAAFYAWLAAHQEDWRTQVKVGEVVLVVDVGGGTTDFTLIAISEEEGKLTLSRLAVGEHILLGGDNMDHALAYHLKEELAKNGTKLDILQVQALGHSCRAAKEKLLADEKAKNQPITILGKGSKLVGGTIKTELTRKDMETLLIEGFFPQVEADAFPRRAVSFGLQEIGLPYTADPVITKHMAQFLARNADAMKEHYTKTGRPVSSMPSVVLFNGGVFKATILQTRVMEVLNHWAKASKSPVVRALQGTDLDLSVARGAAYYAIAQRGKGVRIRGGTAMTYYIGIETAAPAVPGRLPPIKALCVAPMGMEEGTSRKVPGMEFGLYVGEPVRFRFFSSRQRRNDNVGTVLEEWEEFLTEMSPVETKLNAEGDAKPGNMVPVRLESHVTSIGTLELFCVSRDEKHRWKLEFNVREKAEK